MKIKVVKPNSLCVAKVLCQQWDDLIPQGHFVESDGTGFCGFVHDYQHDKFRTLVGKWQTPVIPAGAVEAEYDELFNSGNYSTFKVKELKELARDNVHSRALRAVKQFNFVLLVAGDFIYAIGINTPDRMFSEFLQTLDAEAVVVHSAEKLLPHISSTPSETYRAVSQDHAQEYSFHLVTQGQKWRGKQSGIALINDGDVLLSLEHIKGSCQDNDVMCTFANVLCDSYQLGISASGKKLAFSTLDAPLSFDFSLLAQDQGEAAGNAVYWYDTLKAVADAIMVLSDGNIQVD